MQIKNLHYFLIEGARNGKPMIKVEAPLVIYQNDGNYTEEIKKYIMNNTFYKEEKMSGTLYLCGTPIGNLDDISIRVLHLLKTVDIIAAEDTRHTLHLLNHFSN